MSLMHKHIRIACYDTEADTLSMLEPSGPSPMSRGGHSVCSAFTAPHAMQSTLPCSTCSTGSLWLLQSLVAPLVSAPECGRPDNAACYTITPQQECTGRLASGTGAFGKSTSSVSVGGRGQSGLTQRAHQHGLLVHAYTFRNEVRLLGSYMAHDARLGPTPSLDSRFLSAWISSL